MPYRNNPIHDRHVIGLDKGARLEKDKEVFRSIYIQPADVSKPINCLKSAYIRKRHDEDDKHTLSDNSIG